MGMSWFAERPRVAVCEACGYPTLGVKYCAVCTKDVAATTAHLGLDVPPSAGVTPAA